MKLLVSLVLLALIATSLFAGGFRTVTFEVLVGMAFVLALVAILWLPWKRLNIRSPAITAVGVHATALLALLATAGFTVAALMILAGEIELPWECSGRRRWLCDLVNLLFRVGGKHGAALVFALLAILSLIATAGWIGRAVRMWFARGSSTV